MPSPEATDPVIPITRHDPFAALRFRDFRLLMIGTFVTVIAEQMLNVALGWELYERTRSPLMLGLVGLVQVLPVLALALIAGHTADRFDRKRIVVLTMLTIALCTLGLTVLSYSSGPLLFIYGCLLIIGVARAFQSPAVSSLTAQVVPAEYFSNAATWESSAWQASSIIGPALGGFLIAVQKQATGVYALVATLILAVGLMLGLLRPRPVAPSEEELSLDSLLAGARFIWNTKIIMASITLDMFAVLLGGATALLPVFARDILLVGAEGLGWLRAAPAVGATLAGLSLAFLPPFRHAGRTLLLVVAGFGLATIVFGLSRSFALSLLMLALLGALDNISVVIRSTLLLTRTPDSMRGRVNAVHFVFIGISNELGAFESGVAAALFGTIGAVVGGGIGTILVVGAVALLWPEVRRLGRLNDFEEPPAVEMPPRENPLYTE
ncbi:MAG: MFS transporter [Chloroflexi bacterium SZAS-1]|nr:MFS transporter [Chloroflexi bacterium SZAS-1]